MPYDWKVLGIFFVILGIFMFILLGLVEDDRTPMYGYLRPIVDYVYPTLQTYVYQKPTYDIPKTELVIHESINKERAAHGLSLLEWNPKLNEIARAHSQDMAEKNYFSHFDPEGHGFEYRYANNRFSCAINTGFLIYTGAENIFEMDTVKGKVGGIFAFIPYYIETYHSQDDVIFSAVNGWMESPGHRENILKPFWKSEGIGMKVASNGKIHIAQNFC